MNSEVETTLDWGNLSSSIVYTSSIAKKSFDSIRKDLINCIIEYLDVDEYFILFQLNYRIRKISFDNPKLKTFYEELKSIERKIKRFNQLNEDVIKDRRMFEKFFNFIENLVGLKVFKIIPYILKKYILTKITSVTINEQELNIKTIYLLKALKIDNHVESLYLSFDISQKLLISDILIYNNHLKTLGLRINYPPDISNLVSLLELTLDQNKGINLIVLDIYSCYSQIVSQNFIKIIENKNIEFEIKFYQPFVFDNFEKNKNDFIYCLLVLQKIKKLVFDFNCITSYISLNYSNLLNINENKFSKIVELQLTQHADDKVCEIFGQLLENFYQLKKLDISKSFIEMGLVEITQGIFQLQENCQRETNMPLDLIINHNKKKFSEKSIKSLCELIIGCKILNSLDISNNLDLSYSDIEKITSLFSNKNKISLKNLKIFVSYYYSINLSIFPKIWSFYGNHSNLLICDLSDVGLFDNNLKNLCESLSLNTQIEHLDLSCNKFTEISFPNLVNSLKSKKKLKTLNLSNLNINDNCLVQFSEIYPKYLQNLINLNLSICTYTDKGFEELMNSIYKYHRETFFFKKNKDNNYWGIIRLEELNVGKNKLVGYHGLSCLLSLLNQEALTNLKTIKFPSKITNRLMNSFISVIDKNTQIEVINFSLAFIDNSNADKIKKWLRYHKNLKSITITDADLSEYAQEQVFKGIVTNKSLEYLSLNKHLKSVLVKLQRENRQLKVEISKQD
jgi:hypothetical protein